MQGCSLHLSAPIWGREKPQAGVPSASASPRSSMLKASEPRQSSHPLAPSADGELFQMKEWLE